MEFKKEIEVLDREARDEKLRSEKTIIVMNKIKNLKATVAKQDARVVKLEGEIKTRSERIIKLKMDNLINQSKRDCLQEMVSKQECDIEVLKVDLEEKQELFFDKALGYIKDMNSGEDAVDVKEVVEMLKEEIDRGRKELAGVEGKIEALELVVDLRKKKNEMLKSMVNKLIN